MMTTNPKQHGWRKEGTSRRTRSSAGRGSGTPRVMVAAIFLVLAGAAFLFWPKNSPPKAGGNPMPPPTQGDLSGGTIPEQEIRSSEVDIVKEAAMVTPERPDGSGAAAVQAPPSSPPASGGTTSQRSLPRQEPAAEQAEPMKPGPQGRWAVQTGGFGSAANADQEAARLLEAGWKAIVVAGNNSRGQLVYRVWIGYFETRDEANLFLRQNRGTLGDALVVHR